MDIVPGIDSFISTYTYCNLCVEQVYICRVSFSVLHVFFLCSLAHSAPKVGSLNFSTCTFLPVKLHRNKKFRHTVVGAVGFGQGEIA